MGNMSILNNTIGRTLMQQLRPDMRNLSSFLAMVICLVASKSVHLSAWISHISGDTKAGSRIRRFARWMGNSLIDPHEWYAPIFCYAMREWTQMPIF
jgi:hypothetical protein